MDTPSLGGWSQGSVEAGAEGFSSAGVGTGTVSPSLLQT